MSDRARRTAISAARSPFARLRGPLQWFTARRRLGLAVIYLALGAVAVQLVFIQTIWADHYNAEAANQRSVTLVDPAVRGVVTDRNGRKLAFTVQLRKLTFQPQRIQAKFAKDHAAHPATPAPQERLEKIAKGIRELVGGSVSESDVLGKLKSDQTFVYLAKQVDPQVAEQISERFPDIGSEPQNVRVYPNDSLGANLVGVTGEEGHGLIGLEAMLDSELAGHDGAVTYDRTSDGGVIPGSWRDRRPAVNGSDVQLTIDAEAQYYVQERVQEALEKSGAKHVSAVVLDAKTGEVLAMANDSTFNPALGLANADPASLGNLAVTSPFEPGSVNKVITASGILEYGLSNPDEVIPVPGNLQMGGVSIHDFLGHGTQRLTTAGVFGFSSNIGTLMLAQRLGEDRFMDLVNKFGLGQRTDVGLPGESEGQVPPRDQWSGSTFANLPIGQGLSMTLLQMTDMYQAIANDGLRVPPRIIRSVAGHAEPRPAGVQVVRPETARDVRGMFRAITQRDPMGYQQGTGSTARVAGYQISGKTGTGQQVNPACGCYYEDLHNNITFAGIAPADNPRFVVGIYMDAPPRGADGSGHQTAAPLFHDIAQWLFTHYDVPLSPEDAPWFLLNADLPADNPA
ncbi:MAG: peptidoglycan D,D-transpeptidase FtsI family protein [Segniliparus sp.]|uniref:peptidoglycan D,D-transpeptidase FtsI family protein n=1 Tax=Segniliparus sp. TaxID=2804064 RepID=UPI003F366A85